MIAALFPLLAHWPVVLVPHFSQRCWERGFHPSWLSMVRNGNWRTDSGTADRFLIEAEVVPGDWWRLVVAMPQDRDAIVILTVYPISVNQAAA